MTQEPKKVELNPNFQQRILDDLVTSEKYFQELIKNHAKIRQQFLERTVTSGLNYQEILNNIKTIIFQCDSSGSFVFINSAWTDLLGYQLPQTLGKPFNDFIHNYKQDKELFFLKEASSTKNLQQLYLKHQEGYLLWFELSVKKIDNGFVGVLHNITDHKTTEFSLDQKSTEQKALLGSIPASIFYKNKKLKYIMGNKSFADLIRHKIDEIPGKNDYDFFSREQADRFHKKDKEVISTGKSQNNVEEILTTPDGNKRWVSTSRSPLFNNEGQVIGMVGITIDISERKKAEEEKKKLEEKLAHSQKMEALGLLAGGVAHDLNNILSGIVSYPDLLLLDLPEESSLKKPLETIRESGQKAVAVVADLLTVTRGVASNKEIHNINSIVKKYISSADCQEIKTKNPLIKIKTLLDPDLFDINCSTLHIEKAIMNLVLNASEAMKNGGNIIISTMNQYLDLPIKGYDEIKIGEYAVLAVTDDGPGISSKDLKRIFEPFYSRKVMGRSGTGLGLTVVWNTAKDHNGYINVRSNNKGTTFELFFPIDKEDKTEKLKQPSPSPFTPFSGQGEKILIIDDEKIQRITTQGMLTKLGYQVTAVSSGEEALKFLKDNSVDLVVLDMIMTPGMNGDTTYEKILEIHPKQKAIMVSGFSKTAEMKKAKNLGAGCFIEKPYSIEIIGKAIKEELNKE